MFDMKEKYDTIPPPVSHPQDGQKSSKAKNFARHCLIAVFLCLTVFVVLHKPHFPQKYIDAVKDAACSRHGKHASTTTDPDNSKKVPFEAHIMSKCPDAQSCLHDLVVPAMEQVHRKVDFKLSFIGSASKDSSAVSCRHGPPECVGNILMLCAANLPYPPRVASSSSSPEPQSCPNYETTPVVRYLGFANCMISEYQDIPDRALVQDCALEYGISFNALNKCASRQSDEGDEARDGHEDCDHGPSGLALMRKSFQHSANAGVTKSCTVRVDNKFWCIRDGGEWTDCGEGNERSDVSVLVKEIERLWDERN
ncbi:hypothetical protein TESG_02916 [Trichophyton tonsurans CBS 112818]|uniref:Gamma interferon inducible lysosomal thiol reductase n=1 Tax=Trichophyton tonsurans (strain CBS 112818) TaxID=647933 RepID=F2RVT6_TRIT1|nr:hypothetical protein TESG_02916 [Trichophyton tonsurans CBS 112818]